MHVPQVGCKFGDKCSYAHRQVDEQPSKKSKKNGDGTAVVLLKEYTTIGLRVSGYGAAEIFIDFADELKHIEAKTYVFNSQKQCYVMPTFETKNHRWKIFAQVILISVDPNAPKFEDRSQEETERQERYARDAVWKMERCILRLKEKHKTTFFSPSEN